MKLASHRIRPWLTVLILVAIALSTAVVAAEPANAQATQAEADPYAENKNPLLEGVEPRQDRLISLEQAIALGLQNNLDVQVQRFAPLSAELAAEATWGAYDPFFDAGYDYSNADIRNANALQGGTTASRFLSDTQDGKVSLGGQIPFLGATVGVEVGGGRSENSAPFQLLQPEYTAGVGLTANVPLLQGLIWSEEWTAVKTSAKSRDSARESFRADIMDTVQVIEVSYWDLIARKEQLRVARKSMETSEALLDQTETQYEVGVVSKVDVVEAEAGVAERAFNVIVAENDYESTQDQLVDLVLGTQLTGSSNLRFVPTDAPDQFERATVDVAKAVEVAFAKRAELQAAQREIERLELELKFRKNQRLPQLDFNAGYEASGIAGGPTTADPVLVELDGNLADAFANIGGDRGGNSYQLGAQFTIPLMNTRARKLASIANLDLRKAHTQQIRLEQSIILEVRNAVRTLESSYRGIDAAERRRLAAEEQLRAERIRLEHGESTPFDVLQRERDLVDAESQKIAALQSFRSSAAALERARGTILEIHHISVEEVRPLR